jgi:sugar/nucleoside kinase (ribokinase family)
MAAPDQEDSPVGTLRLIPGPNPVPAGAYDLSEVGYCEQEYLLSGSARSYQIAAERLIEQGGRAVIIKKGEHGALFRSREEEFITPAFPLRTLRDPTGAGDSFAGGFLGWLARCGRLDGDALRQGLACGTAMASLAIESFSPQRLIETLPEEITERVKALHRMVSFRLDPIF